MRGLIELIDLDKWMSIKRNGKREGTGKVRILGKW